MKNAAQSLAKWKTNTEGATDAWVTGLQTSTKPIVSAAKAQGAVAVRNFTDSINSGRWGAALDAIGDGGIKAAAVAKKANFAVGVTAAEQKMSNFFTKLIAYEQAGLASIEQMPKGTLQNGIDRSRAWITYMAAGKGQFK